MLTTVVKARNRRARSVKGWIVFIKIAFTAGFGLEAVYGAVQVNGVVYFSSI